MNIYTVDTITDEADGNYSVGDLSLREAITLASAGDIIQFASGLSGQTIVLTIGELALTKDIIIDGDSDGDDKADIRISGNNTSRIFDISGSGTDVDLYSLRLINGDAGFFGIGFASAGGAIRASSGTSLDIFDSTFSGNRATEGGAIRSTGSNLTMTNSLLVNNDANGRGGAVNISSSSSATLTNTTIYGNEARNNGGGIAAISSSLTLNNSTVAGNTAYSSSTSHLFGAGGIESLGSSSVILNNSVIADNTFNTSSSSGFGDVGGTIDVAVSSFIGANAFITNNIGTTINGSDPLLAALANNGGTTNTLAIEAGSALINAGSNTAIPAGVTQDANGNARIASTTVDIGATELIPVVNSIIDEAADGGTLAADMVDGLGLSLREALAYVGSGDTITFDAALAGQTIILTRGELVLAQSIAVDGDSNGDDKADITISGDNASRIFNISGATTDVNLRSLTLINGSDTLGGAIYANGASSLDISNTTLSGNSASSSGGAIYANNTTTNLVNVLLTGNYASTAGGAATFISAPATLTNTTVYNNSTGGGGGGVLAATTVLTLNNSTIAGNQAYVASASTTGGGGLADFFATIHLNNSVVTDNTSGSTYAADDIYGTVNSASNSFIGTTETINTNTNTTNGGGYAGLLALADNGGATQTIGLRPGSNLIAEGDQTLLPADILDLDNDGNTTEVLPVDANGNARVQGVLDIGAVETTDDAPMLVDNLLDEDDGDYSAGDLSLREAISIIRDGGTIGFDAALAGQSILFTLGELVLTRDVTIDGDIDGDNKADITLDGNNASRIFNISGTGTDVDLLSLTLAHARGTTGGAAIASSGTTLDVIDSTFSLNNASEGGAIFAQGSTLSITNSVLMGNRASFGSNMGTGGGLHLSGSSATLNNTTLYGNFAGEFGGGIRIASGMLELNNSTIFSNTGGAPFAGTTDGGGIYIANSAATVLLNNSVVAYNSASFGARDDIFGTIDIATNSFIGTLESITTSINTVNNGSNPVLGTLLDNGGTTLSLSPLDASPLIDAGSNSVIPADVFDLDGDGNTTELLPIDGRGGLRIVGGTVDIGAVEQIVDETITARETGSTIIGGLGSDILNGLGGADRINGGAGNDIINAGGGDDRVYWSDLGSDIIDGGIGRDTINGNDVDFGASSHFDLAAGTYEVSGNIISTWINFERYDNAGSLSGAEQVTGNSDNNSINTGGGDNSINGNGGNDFIGAGDGADTVDGGSGNDILNGDAGDDILNGGADNDTLNGGTGNDTLNGNAGTDTLNGGDNDDTLDGGPGSDTVNGDDGDDLIIDSNSLGTTDTYDGGLGTDTIRHDSNWASGVTFNLATGQQIFGATTYDTYANIENVAVGGKATIIGDAFNNILTGLSANAADGNTISGGAGFDTLNGGGGADTLNGGDGNDILNGGTENDILNGDALNDALNGDAGDDTLNGGTGNDTLNGGRWRR